MGQKDQVVGEICKLMPSPLESTHLGYRCTTCLVLSFCTQGDLSKSEHMLG